MNPITTTARRRLRAAATLTALTGGTLAAGLVFAGIASAHVKVSGIDAVQGGSGVITFRVPSESDTASTTGLLITFPSSTPFTEVDTQPKAGWTAKVITRPLAKPEHNDDGDLIKSYVYQVDFRATSKAAGIPPGQFDMFNLSVGPFPKAASMSFAALQTYSDGSTVNWDEQSANGAEPEHPAPVLQLAPAAASADAAAAPVASAATGDGAGDPSSPAWPGITGLVAGLVALVVSVVALAMARSRRRTAGPPA
jgi:periplasmic copper chaperone A